MEEKLLEIINSISVNAGGEQILELKEAFDLRKDLGFDSFQLAELTVHIEEHFGVDVFEDGLINTIREIKEKIESHE